MRGDPGAKRRKSGVYGAFTRRSLLRDGGDIGGRRPQTPQGTLSPGNSHSRAVNSAPCDFRCSAYLHPPGNSHSRILRMLLVIPNSSPTFNRHRRRWASVPLAAAGSGPRLGVWGDWSRARPVGDEARRNVGNGKERLRDYSVSRPEIPHRSHREANPDGRLPNSPVLFENRMNQAVPNEI